MIWKALAAAAILALAPTSALAFTRLTPPEREIISSGELEKQASIFLRGIPASGSSTILTTFNIVNIGTVQQDAGFDSPSEGIAFPSCTDAPTTCVPSGQAPLFQDVVTGATLPYSWTCMSDNYATSNCSAWPDGSLRHAGFIFRDPENIATGASFTGSQSGTTLTVSGVTGTIAIGQEVFGQAAQGMAAETITARSGSNWTVSYSQTVASGSMTTGTIQQVYLKNGGTPPASSGRSLTDVYNQAISVHAASVGSAYCAWTGDQYAYLDDPGSDANNWLQTKFMDGAVGAGWEVWSHFAPSQGGTPQGQLELTSYVYALNDSSGTFAAVRDLQRVHQPWYNPSNTTGINWCGLSALTWQQNGNSRSFIPSTLTASPFAAVNFSTTGAGGATFTGCIGATSLCITPGNNLYVSSVTGTVVKGETLTGSGVTSATITGGSGTTWTISGTAQTVSNESMYTVSNIYTSASNNLEQGAPTGEGGGPGYAVLLSSVSGPSNLPTSQLAWIGVKGPTTFQLSEYSGLAYPILPNTLGTGTLTPIMAILYYSGLFNETSNCKYNFFQPSGYGGTYPANDNTVIVQFSTDYLRLTHMLPPYGNVTGVNDNTFSPTTYYPGNNNQCFPGSEGPTQTYMEAAGPRDDVGPETGWASRDFFNQSPGDDILVRSLGFAGANFPYDVRDRVTSEPLVTRPPLAGGSYTGMPSPITNSTYQVGQQWVGLQSTPVYSNAYGYSTIGNSHMPELAYYAELKTGEPQFKDLLQEQGNSEMMGAAATYRNSHGLVAPCGDYDTLFYGGSQFRGMAWNLRDLMLAAAISPAVDPDGSQKTQYYQDVEITNSKYVDCEMSNGLLGAYSVSTGLFEPAPPSAPAATGAPSFQDAYFNQVLAYAAGTNKDSYALDFLTNYAAKWRLHVLNTFGGYDLYPEYGNVVVNANGGYTGTALIPSDTYYGIEPPVMQTFTWTNSSPAFTLTLSGTTSGYVPAANDIWLFTDGVPAPGYPTPLTYDTPYCATNLTAVTSLIYKFDLFLRPSGGCIVGGSTILPTGTGNMLIQSGPVGPMVQPINPPAASTGYAPTAIAGYPQWAQAAERWMQADGIPGLGTETTGLIGDATVRMSVGGVTNADLAASPIFSLSACYTSATC